MHSQTLYSQARYYPKNRAVSVKSGITRDLRSLSIDQINTLSNAIREFSLYLESRRNEIEPYVDDKVISQIDKDIQKMQEVAEEYQVFLDRFIEASKESPEKIEISEIGHLPIGGFISSFSHGLFIINTVLVGVFEGIFTRKFLHNLIFVAITNEIATFFAASGDKTDWVKSIDRDIKNLSDSYKALKSAKNDLSKDDTFEKYQERGDADEMIAIISAIISDVSIYEKGFKRGFWTYLKVTDSVVMQARDVIEYAKALRSMIKNRKLPEPEYIQELLDITSAFVQTLRDARLALTKVNKGNLSKAMHPILKDYIS